MYVCAILGSNSHRIVIVGVTGPAAAAVIGEAVVATIEAAPMVTTEVVSNSG